ncbi:MAG: hypothetical protein J7M27_04750 [Candidatus Latescibacteria bacterium]|nr:hypothetical protein [Candidatus Latescibacterota bacterium]
MLYIAALIGGRLFEQKEILGHPVSAELELSESTIKTSLARFFQKRLLIRPDKFKHAVPDRLFGEYISQIRGYDGEGSQVENR